MNNSSLAGLILPACCVWFAGCPAPTPDPVFDLPAFDYGVSIDTIAADTGSHDVKPPEDTSRDQGTVIDNGATDTAAIDTGPCTKVCSAYQRCGPDPCGSGECKPGCGGDKPICNLETRQCEPEECSGDCGTKVCGYDQCGAPCGPLDGKCPNTLHCNYTTGSCGTDCYPNCGGKACGDDGCGKTCPPGCPDGVECHADGYCISEGQCQKSSNELKCEADKNSGSGSTAWNIGTTSMALFNYSAACGSTFNPGPEKAFKFVVGPNESGVLEVSISQTLPLLATFLNVYLIEDTGSGCTAASCVAAGSPQGSSTKTFQYEVPPSPTGHTYYLVADASTSNDGFFTITIKKCTWNEFDDEATETADQ